MLNSKTGANQIFMMKGLGTVETRRAIFDTLPVPWCLLCWKLDINTLTLVFSISLLLFESSKPRRTGTPRRAEKKSNKQQLHRVMFASLSLVSNVAEILPIKTSSVAKEQSALWNYFVIWWGDILVATASLLLDFDAAASAQHRYWHSEADGPSGGVGVFLVCCLTSGPVTSLATGYKLEVKRVSGCLILR